MSYITYKENLQRFNNVVVIMKEGKKYSAYELNALIINYYFGNKLCYKDDFFKVTFERNSLDYIKDNLLDQNLTVVIVEGNTSTVLNTINNNYLNVITEIIKNDLYKNIIMKYINTIDIEVINEIISLLETSN